MEEETVLVEDRKAERMSVIEVGPAYLSSRREEGQDQDIRREEVVGEEERKEKERDQVGRGEVTGEVKMMVRSKANNRG